MMIRLTGMYEKTSAEAGDHLPGRYTMLDFGGFFFMGRDILAGWICENGDPEP